MAATCCLLALNVIVFIQAHEAQNDMECLLFRIVSVCWFHYLARSYCYISRKVVQDPNTDKTGAELMQISVLLNDRLLVGTGKHRETGRFKYRKACPNEH